MCIRNVFNDAYILLSNKNNGNKIFILLNPMHSDKIEPIAYNWFCHTESSKMETAYKCPLLCKKKKKLLAPKKIFFVFVFQYKKHQVPLFVLFITFQDLRYLNRIECIWLRTVDYVQRNSFVLIWCAQTYGNLKYLRRRAHSFYRVMQLCVLLTFLWILNRCACARRADNKTNRNAYEVLYCIIFHVGNVLTCEGRRVESTRPGKYLHLEWLGYCWRFFFFLSNERKKKNHPRTT